MAFLIGWGSPFDADDHTYKVFGTDKGANYSGYYNADATDKAVFAHNIQSDIVMDIIKANADTISGILEDGK